jgi:hypothetical protein
MTSIPSSNTPLPMWQSASGDAQFSAPADCMKRANKFEQRVRIRNAIEFVAGGLVILLFTGLTIGAVIKDELGIALASVLILAGIGAVLWSLHRRAGNLDRRPEDTCLGHLRRQYHQQYSALNAVPRWYIGPPVPGIVLLFGVITARVAEVAGWARAIEGIAGPAAIVMGAFSLIILANWIAARSLKRQIDALDALADLA